MKYKILWSDSVDALEDDVNSHLKDGWLPQGGMQVVRAFYQAMMKQGLEEREERESAKESLLPNGISLREAVATALALLETVAPIHEVEQARVLLREVRYYLRNV